MRLRGWRSVISRPTTGKSVMVATNKASETASVDPQSLKEVE
jgi:hypothetical protein